MIKKMILHDLSENDAVLYLPEESESVTHFTVQTPVRNCMGCFGCWVKTPGICVIKDEVSAFGKMMPNYDVFIVVSRCVYGGLSPDVKVVLERNICVGLPFFHIVNNEMHHLPRYKKMPNLAYHFYGSGMTEHEKKTARKLTAANALNLYAPNHTVFFHSSMEEIKEALL